MLTLEQLRTPGTPIPLPGGTAVQFRAVDWEMSGSRDSSNIFNLQRQSFGSKIFNDDVEYILVESAGFLGSNYYMVPVSEFERLGIVDSYKLPEKWAVMRTNNTYDVINGWINEKINGADYSDSNGYIHFPNYYNHRGFNAGSHSNSDIMSDYTEITFEQFQKYVLNKPIIEKKIIGYKVPFNMWNNTIKAGEIVVSDGGHGYKISRTSNSDKFPKEIVEKWEPVYEAETVTIGDYTSKKEGNLIAFGCYKFTKGQLEAYKHLLLQEGSLAKINVKGTEITVKMIEKLLNL